MEERGEEMAECTGAEAAAAILSLGNTAAEEVSSGDRGEAGAEDGVGEEGEGGDDMVPGVYHDLSTQRMKERVRNRRHRISKKLEECDASRRACRLEVGRSTKRRT